MATLAESSSSAVSSPAAAPEPVLTPREKKVYGQMQEHMTYYHDHFRSDFDTIYKFADKPERITMNTKTFLRYALSLHTHLNAHHGMFFISYAHQSANRDTGIEERYIFPILAKKMPEFKNEHISEHKKIHDGLDRYEAYISKFKTKEDLTEYNPEDLRQVMDSFKEVLFYHLDAELHSLRAENMKKYWTEAELRQIPM